MSYRPSPRHRDFLAEVFGQLPQIARSAFDTDSNRRFDHRQVAVTVARIRTRVVSAGTRACLAIHSGVINAATVIGSTSTVKSKSTPDARSDSTDRSECSASRPVTK